MTASSTCCLGGEKRGLTLHSDTTVPSTLTSTLTVPVFYEQQVEESNLLTSGCCSGAGRVGVGRLDADKARVPSEHSKRYLMGRQKGVRRQKAGGWGKLAQYNRQSCTVMG